MLDAKKAELLIFVTPKILLPEPPLSETDMRLTLHRHTPHSASEIRHELP
jgi:hypothetical protein